ncbi:DUF6328 family protein [Kitasatospora sp. NPDC098663]|uniref:DUF6328 family protein n=1 Tax=Kitasatospora sp. NPDC098663 TaxID=3364096 RepID=UPI0037FE7C6B
MPDFDEDLYDATVVLGAIATGTLVAPVAFHRFLAGHGMKPELIHIAGRLIDAGLVTLALTIAAALLLLLSTATGNTTVAWILSAVLLWFTTAWLVLPQIVLRRTARQRRATQCRPRRSARPVLPRAPDPWHAAPHRLDWQAPRFRDRLSPWLMIPLRSTWERNCSNVSSRSGVPSTPWTPRRWPSSTATHSVWEAASSIWSISNRIFWFP